MNAANGQYITFLDSDDQYLLHHLSSRKHFLTLNPETELLHGGVKVVGDPYVVDRNNPYRLVRAEKCALGGTFFIRKDALQRVGSFYDLPYGEDTDFFERAREAGITIHSSNVQSYVYHRDHDLSLTARFAKARHLLPRIISRLANWKKELRQALRMILGVAKVRRPDSA